MPNESSRCAHAGAHASNWCRCVSEAAADEAAAADDDEEEEEEEEYEVNAYVSAGGAGSADSANANDDAEADADKEATDRVEDESGDDERTVDAVTAAAAASIDADGVSRLRCRKWSATSSARARGPNVGKREGKNNRVLRC